MTKRIWFIDEKEPEDKISYVTLRKTTELWNGKEWVHMSLTFSRTAIGMVRDEIKAEALSCEEVPLKQ